MTKSDIRKSVLARRDATDPGFRIDAALSLAGFAGDLDLPPGAIVAGFLPIRSEIDLRPLMDVLRARGHRLCLPAVTDRETIVFRAFVRDAGLVATGFGTAGPPPDAAVLDPDAILMPLAAFDAAGNRLGYGAGHYDRAIARLHERGLRPRLIGCGFDLQEVERIPADAHDVALHAVLTETGLRRIGQAR